jgi:uncharacterized membrane-anchored protein YitT (DUF2179 family)
MLGDMEMNWTKISLALIIFVLFAMKIIFLLHPNKAFDDLGFDGIAWGLLLIWALEFLADGIRGDKR